MKKFMKSPITYIYFAVALLLFIYTVWQVKSVCAEIKVYYEQVQGSAKFSEYLTYSLQAALQPLVFALLTAGVGFVHNETRKLNASYYKTQEELDALKEAKKQAKEAVQKAKIGSTQAFESLEDTASEDKKETAEASEEKKEEALDESAKEIKEESSEEKEEAPKKKKAPRKKKKTEEK